MLLLPLPHPRIIFWIIWSRGSCTWQCCRSIVISAILGPNNHQVSIFACPEDVVHYLNFPCNIISRHYSHLLTGDLGSSTSFHRICHSDTPCKDWGSLRMSVICIPHSLIGRCVDSNQLTQLVKFFSQGTSISLYVSSRSGAQGYVKGTIHSTFCYSFWNSNTTSYFLR
jgi:hypothetical protein